MGSALRNFHTNAQLRSSRYSRIANRLNTRIRNHVFRQSVPRAFPRSLNLRVHLTMLSWFLTQELPSKFPEVFSETISVEPLLNQGWSNFVFKADGYLVRMQARDGGSRSQQWAPYHKEAFAIEALAGRVPVPALIGEGIGYVATPHEMKEYAYFIQSYIQAPTAESQRSSFDNRDFRRQLGSIARRINTTDCVGYGTSYSAADRAFTFKTWEEALDVDIASANIDRLVTLGVLDRQGAALLNLRFETLKNIHFSPQLFHGDFAENWSNVLTNRGGSVQSILDWELAGSGPATEMEFALLLYMMLRDGRSKAQIREDFGDFLMGYGISYREYFNRYAEHVETLILLQAIKKCNRYLDIDLRGELREHAWRVEFFERCKELIRLGAHLSEIKNSGLYFAF